MKNIPTVSEYRKYDPYAESIIYKNGIVIVINRYDVDDYSAYYTDPEHMYDETYGSSCRGSLESVINDIKSRL